MTPVRSALAAKSSLHAAVLEGTAALKKKHKQLIHTDVQSDFLDSIDLDASLAAAHPTANRWDYLLGHATGHVVGLEPHTATTHEIKVVRKKRARALEQLKPHLKPSAVVAEWFWVASGKIDFIQHEKATLLIAEAGVTFVGKMLAAKHLKGLTSGKKGS